MRPDVWALIELARREGLCEPKEARGTEHLCACPNCGLAIAVPCVGEVIADVRVADIVWCIGPTSHPERRGGA